MPASPSSRRARRGRRRNGVRAAGPGRDDLDVRPARAGLSRRRRHPAGAGRRRALRDPVLAPDARPAAPRRPTGAESRRRSTASVYGIGPGLSPSPTRCSGTSGTASYYDLEVTYSQPTNLLLFPGPTITVSRSKRVWIATDAPSLSELRLPLREEGRDRLLDFGRVEPLGEMSLSSFIRSRISSLRARAQQLLGQAQRLGRLGQQRGDDLVQRLASSPPGGSDVADEADVQRFVGSERLGQQQIARGAPASGEPRQQQRARRFRHQRRDRRTASRSARLPRRSPGRSGAASSCRCRRNCRAPRRRSASRIRPAPAAAATPGFRSSSRGRPRGNRRGRCRRRSPGLRREW